jgi:23S rRNA-/tRNA-specific pseudouridylate synthase
MQTVFRDAWLLVVDKPAGLPSQSTQKGEDNAYDQVKREFPGAALLHRLDQPASGLLLFGIDPTVNGALTEMFREHRIERIYAAVLAGPARDATWDRPIEGKPARTHVKRIGEGGGFTAVECRLETGRTHQIRIHAASAGVPIVGDRKYGGDAGRWWPRLALHAWRMGFDHPKSGERVVLQAEVPADLHDLWVRGQAFHRVRH